MFTNSLANKLEVNVKATIYTTSTMFGNIVKIEAVELRMWRAPFAQYNDALHFEWRAYRQRNFRRIVEGNRPYFLVLRGWSHPDPLSFTVPGTSDVDVFVSRYSSFDTRWRTAFNETIAAYLTKRSAIVLADTRDLSE